MSILEGFEIYLKIIKPEYICTTSTQGPFIAGLTFAVVKSLPTRVVAPSSSMQTEYPLSGSGGKVPLKVKLISDESASVRFATLASAEQDLCGGNPIEMLTSW